MSRSTMTPIVLAMVSERPMYGYEIVKAVDARTNGALQLKEGTLYPLLHKLQGQKLIKASWRDGPFGKARKYYGITPKGHRLLQANREEWNTLRTAVDTLLLGA